MSQQAQSGQDDTIEALGEELRRLARIRTLADYRTSSWPLLHACCDADAGGSSSSSDGVRTRLEAAIDGVDDPQYRDAAYALLGFHDQRWSSLKTRQFDAASAFGVGFDAFRRSRSGKRPSLYDQTLREVARQLHERSADHTTGSVDDPDRAESATTTSAAPAVAPLPAPQASAPAPPAAAGRGRLPVVVASAAAALALAAIGFVAGRVTGAESPGDSSALGGLDIDSYCRLAIAPDARAVQLNADAGGWRCSTALEVATPVDFGDACAVLFGPGAEARLLDWSDSGSWECFLGESMEDALPNDPSSGCAIEPGAYISDASGDLARFAGSFRTAMDEQVRSDTEPCPAGPLHRRGPGVAQDLAEDGRTVGAIYANDEEQATVLVGPAWEAYNRFGGGHGMSASLMGYPTSQPAPINGGWVVDGDQGGALVAGAEDGPYFLLPALSLQVWLQAGDAGDPLGSPVSDFYGSEAGIRQDFEHGYVLLDQTGVRIVRD